MGETLPTLQSPWSKITLRPSHPDGADSFVETAESNPGWGWLYGYKPVLATNGADGVHPNGALTTRVRGQAGACTPRRV